MTGQSLVFTFLSVSQVLGATLCSVIQCIGWPWCF